MPRLLLAAVLVGAVSLAGSLAGCSSEEPKKPAAPKPTPIAKLDSGAVRPARAEFCDLVPDRAVRRALGLAADATVPDAAAWGNGDPAPGLSSADHAQEYGCRWTSGSRVAAAWVFARPVTTTFAAQVVAATGQQKGCRAAPSPVFGTPSVQQTCPAAGGLVRLRRAGLFSGTWLTCEVTAPAATAQRDADAWCVEVANALDVNR